MVYYFGITTSDELDCLESRILLRGKNKVNWIKKDKYKFYELSPYLHVSDAEYALIKKKTKNNSIIFIG